MIRILPARSTPKRNSHTRERFGHQAPNYISLARSRAASAVDAVNQGLGLPSGDWFEIDSGRSVVLTRIHEGQRYYMNSPLVNWRDVGRWMKAAHRAGHAPEKTVVTPTVVATSEVQGHEMDAEHFDLVEDALKRVSNECSDIGRDVWDLLRDRESSGIRRAGIEPERQETLRTLREAVAALSNDPHHFFICHGDLATGNVFMEGDRVVFIDPEPFKGHVYYDLVRLSTQLGVDVQREKEGDLLATIKEMTNASITLYRQALKQK